MPAPVARGKDLSKGDWGSTLVEVMVAAVILVIGLVSLLTAIASSMVVDAAAKEHNLALDFSRETLEHVRAQSFGFLLCEKTAVGEPPPDVPIVTDWYGGPLLQSTCTSTSSIPGGETDRYSCAEMKTIDQYGYFSVRSRRGSLNERDATRKVGRTRVNAVPGKLDVVEVVVTLEWRGVRGNTRQELRSLVPDWRMPYYGVQ